MAKDPTQGPVSTYDAEGNPIVTNVDAPVVEEVAEDEVAEETTEDEVPETDASDAAPEDDIETYAKVPESEEAIEGEGAESEVEEVQEEAPEEEDAEEVEFEIHEDAMVAPLSYGEAETLLKETPFLKLREMAIAEEMKPKRSKQDIINQLLGVWFAPSEAPRTEEQPEMSVRIRRAKGLL